jgi:nascent polypeptide-associated complex subunit alpha
MPGMNPRQMQDMMRKMGMQQVSVDAEQVIIRTKDKDIIIENPDVSKVTMMGQQTWQITGQVREEKRVLSAAYTPAQDDIDTVAEQASVSKDKAKKALEETQGDIAEAILKLSE